jgi:hypothetical protein
MPTHLYCLLPAGGEAAPAPDTGSVRVLEVGGIAAWVGDSATERLPRDKRRAAVEAIEHDRIIGSALSRGVTPLPATLTDPYLNDEEALADIANRAGEIRASLSEIDGAVEMAVIVAGRGPLVPSSASPAEARPGRAYLERVRDLPNRLAALADEIDSRLQMVVLASSRRIDADRLGLSHLVLRGRVDEYRSLALRCVFEGYRVVVDGPRAPYSFAAFSPGTTPNPGPPISRHEIGKLNRDEKT